jgi:hypothetical protein
MNALEGKMVVFRRVALIVSIVLCGLLAVAGTSIASGGPGGGPPPAGNYQTTTLRASFQPSAKGPFASAVVTRTSHVSRPLGGPFTSSTETDLILSVFSDTLNVSGCFILGSPQDFTINGAQTAALNTTVSNATPTCAPAYLVPPVPITLNVTWSGATATATSHDNKLFSCVTYSSETQTTDVSSNSNGVAIVTSTLFTGSFTTTNGSLGSNRQSTHVQGTLDQSCPPGPSGKGAGPGPKPAGNYHNTNQLTGFSDGSSVGVFVNRGTAASNPAGGPATSTAETDVNVQELGGSAPGSSCFVVTKAPDFTQSGVQSASLNTAFDSSTPTCLSYGTPVTVPLTVAVNWTGTGPVATTRDVSRFSCLTYSTESTNIEITRNATGTATLTSETLSGTFAASFGYISTSDVRIHAQGVDQNACIVRN